MELNTFCDYPFKRVRITAEGQVSMCCFHRSGSIGSLVENTFDEIWHGEIAEEIRRETVSGKLHTLCQQPGCPYMTNDLEPHKFEYNEYPVTIEIDLPNTHCNVGGYNPTEKRPACIMCERSDPNFIKEVDLMELVLPKIKHVMPNVWQLHIQGIAEPFWHDQIYKILDILDFEKHKDRIQITTTTNGILFREENRKRWLDAVPHSVVVFSIDASTPDTFFKVRGSMKNVFPLIIKHLHEYSQERRRNDQWVKIHNNINTMNVQEVMGMVQIGKSAGVDVVEFNPTSGFKTEILANELNAKVFRRAHLEIIEEASRLGQKVEFIRPLDLGFAGGFVEETSWEPDPDRQRLVQLDLGNMVGNNPDHHGRRI
jgi:molybdenum cofactor biosynthesis enzyme MoaA